MRFNISLTAILKISLISTFIPLSIGALFICLLFLDGMASWQLNKCPTLLSCGFDSIGRLWDVYFLKIFLLLWGVSFGLLMWGGRDVWQEKI